MKYDFKNKVQNIKQLNRYMLAKTLGMFKYENLPETLPENELEKLLQQKGLAFIYEHDGNIYAFNGSLGGKSDAYGNATEFTISNPHINLNTTVNINDGVLIKNDDFAIGLIPMLNRFSSHMVENDINLMIHGYNSRLSVLISAPDDKTKQSADSYMTKIIDGEVSVIGENSMFDGLKTHSQSGNNTLITGMIEYNQYLKGSLYNELGLNANFNMKRERLNIEEVTINEDSLFPYVYAMLEQREKAVKKINEKYSLNVTVEFGSVWKQKHDELTCNDETKKEPKPDVSGEPVNEPKNENYDDLKIQVMNELGLDGDFDDLSDEDKQAVIDLIKEVE